MWSCFVEQINFYLRNTTVLSLLVAAFDNSHGQQHPELRIYSPRQGIHSPGQEIYR